MTTTAAACTMSDESSGDYCRSHLPDDVVEKLEAEAFKMLCQHLQERSEEVANIDLMNLSGFCRNCLAKWMVVGARRLVDEKQVDASVIPALDALGYPEAAQHVYGMKYGDWKSRYQKKATAEQLKAFNEHTELQAKHDKELLKTRTTSEKPPLLSNVCCQDEEQVAAVVAKNRKPRTTPSYVYKPPALPHDHQLSAMTPLRVGVLTVSDRAFRNEYESGDLSGPAVVKAVQSILPTAAAWVTIVPDDASAIQSQLKVWCQEKVPMVLTTGGTGFGPRDVTPEATRGVLDQECAGLLAFCTTECSRLQPLASLSRGTAGYCQETVIANLPGNPKGVAEIIPILFPLLLHAVVEMQGEQEV